MRQTVQSAITAAAGSFWFGILASMVLMALTVVLSVTPPESKTTVVDEALVPICGNYKILTTIETLANTGAAANRSLGCPGKRLKGQSCWPHDQETRHRLVGQGCQQEESAP
jgi:hypothetical protein